MKNDIPDINMPDDYFQLSEEDKRDVCVGLLQSIYDTIIKPSSGNTIELFDRIFSTTMEYHIKLENYEICGVIRDTKRIFDEQKNNRLYK